VWVEKVKKLQVEKLTRELNLQKSCQKVQQNVAAPRGMHITCRNKMLQPLLAYFR
jgi:hypothetical protein